MQTATHPTIQAVKAPQPFKAQYLPLKFVRKPNLKTVEPPCPSQTWRVKACRVTPPEGLRPKGGCGKLARPTVGAMKLPGVGRMSAFEQFRAVVNTGWVLAKLVDVLLHLLGC
jgi:hypothetical protein